MKTNPNSPYSVAVLARNASVGGWGLLGFWRSLIGL